MNSIFSKIISVILVVLILFSIFRYIYLDYSTYQKNNPYLVEYDKTINSLTEIPNSKFNVSEDQRQGIEFTYAFWLNVNDKPPDDQSDIMIFSKGKNNEELKLSLKFHDDNNNSFNIPKETIKNIYLLLKVPIYKADNSSKCLNFLSKDECLPPCDWDGSFCHMSKCSAFNPRSSDDLAEVERAHSTPQERGEGGEGVPGSGRRSQPSDEGVPDTGSPPSVEVVRVESRDSTPRSPNNYGNCDDYDFCYKKDDTTCEDREFYNLVIQNIPYKKWFHISLVFINKYVDIYINGNLYNRFELVNIIKQNNNNLVFGDSNSRIMRLQYFNYALPSYKIQSLVSNTDITSEPEENKYVDGNYFNNKYWVKDYLGDVGVPAPVPLSDK